MNNLEKIGAFGGLVFIAYGIGFFGAKIIKETQEAYTAQQNTYAISILEQVKEAGCSGSDAWIQDGWIVERCEGGEINLNVATINARVDAVMKQYESQ